MISNTQSQLCKTDKMVITGCLIGITIFIIFAYLYSELDEKTKQLDMLNRKEARMILFYADRGQNSFSCYGNKYNDCVVGFSERGVKPDWMWKLEVESCSQLTSDIVQKKITSNIQISFIGFKCDLYNE